MNTNSRQKNQLTHFAEMNLAAPAKTADAAPIWGAAGGALARFASVLLTPSASPTRRHRLYEDLTELDDRLLADIGIERADIPHIADDVFRNEAAAPGTLRHAVRQRSTGAKD